MADPLTLLDRRSGRSPLFASPSAGDRWQVAWNSATTELARLSPSDKPLRILLAERDPIALLARLMAAIEAGHWVFLCNPNWEEREWQEVDAIAAFDCIWGTSPLAPRTVCETSDLPAGLILIPTGGTTGQMRFAMHTWQTLTAAASGFQTFFQLPEVNSFCVLPLYHVSGLMQFVRSLVSGGQLRVESSASLLAGEWLSLPPETWTISLVPTQLQRLLADATLTGWLRRCRLVLLGGAPPWPHLLEVARKNEIPLAIAYGATETAALVAALSPARFEAGQSGCGYALPHANLSVVDAARTPLASPQIGRIAICSHSLALGYYPHCFLPEIPWESDDLGYFDAQGSLHVVGRRRDCILTGGENVFPAEVEAAIRVTGCVSDVAVIGIEDGEWGQVVTAIYVPNSAQVWPAQMQTRLQGQLAKYKHPKRWIAVDALPRNPQGKLDRDRLRDLANLR
jgi:O-succinylbenzoic acid--CoA ligase